MKTIDFYITEKLRLDKNTKGGYTDEELRSDWNDVWNSFSLSEKQPYKEKYGVNSNKKEDIQDAILDRLRDNRQNKKGFDDKDIKDFYRYHMKERDFEKYLDEEPLEFVKTLLADSENKANKEGILKYASVINRRDWRGFHLSYADKDLLQRYLKLKKYLEKH